jgi:hypothetical protein
MSPWQKLKLKIWELLTVEVPNDKLPPLYDPRGPSERRVDEMKERGKKDNVVSKTIYRW